MSLFSKDPGADAAPSPYSKDRIEKEIAHLRKGTSVRHQGQAKRARGSVFLIVLAGFGLLWLFFMDPVLYSFHRGDAIRDYLYLHNCGSDKKAAELLASGIFKPNEIEILNQRQGSFQNYYPNLHASEQTADDIIGYMSQLAYLHHGPYQKLNTLGKIRYQLFVRFGLHPPTHWGIFDPAVNP